MGNFTAVSSGHSTTGLVLKNGDYEQVLSGGTAVGTITSSGGFEDVDSGGVASGGTIYTSGQEDTRQGAHAFGLVVSSGGQTFVEGTASGTVVDSGGLQNVLRTGVDDGTTVSGGAFLYNEGVASGTTIADGAEEFVFSGATANATSVASGGVIIAMPGSTVNATGAGLVTSTGVVYVSGGHAVSANSITGLSAGGPTFDPITVLQGGTTTSALITGRAQETVYSGGQAIATTASGGNGFGLSVASGGTATGTIVSSGSFIGIGGGTATGTILRGGGDRNYDGTEFDTIVSSGGVQFLNYLGVSSNTVVSNGGTAQIGSGGTAVGTVVSSGGTFSLLSGSDAGATILSGAVAFVSSAGTAEALAVSNGGDVTVLSGGTANDTSVASGGIETVLSGGTASATSFAAGGRIDLPYLTFTNGGTAYINNAGLLNVTQGTTSYTQQLANYAGETVALTQDTTGGTLVTILCFATGTRLRTAQGDTPVEALRVGDLAVTASGGLRPIRWLGHRTLDCQEDRSAPNVSPVLVAAHAFGAGLPARDLFLSPGHPVLVGADEDGEGGHLVPIMCLINGTSVRRVAVESVTYWHVELDEHDILLAEGLPAESYLDWGDRGFFTEGSDHALQNPDFVVPGLAGRCRPVAIDGPVVEAERRRLDEMFARSIVDACAWPDREAYGSILDAERGNAFWPDHKITSAQGI